MTDAQNVANIVDADFSAENEHVAPCNIEAEQAVLGAIFLSNEAYYKVSSFLNPDHFYDPLHKRIYDECAAFINAGRVADPVTLKPRFESDSAIIEAGGVGYLANLASAAISILSVVDYGREIFDMAVRRGLIELGQNVAQGALDPNSEESPTEQIENAEHELYSLAEAGKYEGGFQGLPDALKESIAMAAAAFERDSHLSGLSTGITQLDNQLGGLQPSDLVILAARPGMGKSALACNIAFNVAKTYKVEKDQAGIDTVVDGAAVGLFSLEMSSEQLATRLLAEESGVPSTNMRRGQIDEEEFRRIQETARTLQNVPLYIDDSGGLSIAAIAARARRLKRNADIGLLIVDYIQLASASGKKKIDNRVQEITEITQSLKALAKELNVPILALSQLSRAVESRDDKRPQLSDLRESGSIEQDADVVLFIYREQYYLENTKPAEEEIEKFAEWQDKMTRAHGKAEVIIGKQRHGPTGKVNLAFQGNIMKFSNLAQDDYYRGDNFDR